MQKQEENIVVVHLRDYLVDADWDGVLDTNKPSIKISAGASILRMMQIIRPAGYLTPSAPAGRIFSVGGAYLNPSVVGSVYTAGRIASHVASARVMLANGTIAVYEGDDVVE